MAVTIAATLLTQWRQQARQQAIAAQIAPAEVDWLLQALGVSRLSLRLGFDPSEAVTLPLSLGELGALWRRRWQERCPLQYLVGKVPWRQFELTVSPAVLIPRPETELIVDLALAAVQASPQAELAAGHWVDLGTGSGAIALGLAAVLPAASIYGVDCSPAAVAIAQENAARCGLSPRITFAVGSWWSPLTCLAGKISGMVANPPYIPRSDLESLQPEVARHEPRLALDGGEDGLESLRYLLDTAPQYLHSGGVWLVELMAGQAPAIAGLLEAAGSYENIEIFQDLAGIERFVRAYRL